MRVIAGQLSIPLETAAPTSPKLQQKNEGQKHPKYTDEATYSPVKHVMTEDEDRTRVSRKAYELYEKRRTSTQLAIG